MRFDSGPEVFVRVNRNYVLTEYVLNENDCTVMLIFVFDFKKEELSEFERLGALPSYNLFLIFFFFKVYH